MNSLRATSSSRSCDCISLKVRVSWPSSSSESTGSGSMKRPWAISSAARSRRPIRRASACATRKRADQRQRERDARREQHAVAHEVDGVGHVVEVARVEDHGRGLAALAVREERLRDLGQLLARQRPDLGAHVLGGDRRRARLLLNGASFSVRESDWV